MAELPIAQNRRDLDVLFSKYDKVIEVLEIYKQHVNHRPRSTPIENEILLTVLMSDSLKLSYDVVKKYVKKMDPLKDKQDLDELIEQMNKIGREFIEDGLSRTIMKIKERFPEIWSSTVERLGEYGVALDNLGNEKILDTRNRLDYQTTNNEILELTGDQPSSSTVTETHETSEFTSNNKKAKIQLEKSPTTATYATPTFHTESDQASDTTSTNEETLIQPEGNPITATDATPAFHTESDQASDTASTNEETLIQPEGNPTTATGIVPHSGTESHELSSDNAEEVSWFRKCIYIGLKLVAVMAVSGVIRYVGGPNVDVDALIKLLTELIA